MTKPLNVEAVAQTATEALDRAKAMPPDERPAGAINWADLHVVSIERITEVWPPPGATSGETFWRVIIEEASPNTSNLCAYVGEALSAKFPDHGIVVVAEW